MVTLFRGRKKCNCVFEYNIGRFKLLPTRRELKRFFKNLSKYNVYTFLFFFLLKRNLIPLIQNITELKKIVNTTKLKEA